MQLVSNPFEHSNESPPRPDIRVSIDGKDYYFELGEITDEGLARSIHIALKTKEVTGCALSQVDPLAKMLKQKCEKKYETNGAPVDLLLYYWRQRPYQPAIQEYMDENRCEIGKLLKSGQFDQIWIYDWQSGKVLQKIER
jgi:hypothetical protein